MTRHVHSPNKYCMLKYFNQMNPHQVTACDLVPNSKCRGIHIVKYINGRKRPNFTVSVQTAICYVMLLVKSQTSMLTECTCALVYRPLMPS